VGRDVRYGLFEVEGPGTVIEAYVEVHALLSAGVGGLVAGLDLDATDGLAGYALERYGHVGHRRLADGGVE
jgi:hypothetical protein